MQHFSHKTEVFNIETDRIKSCKKTMKGNILIVSPEKCLQDERVLVKMQNLSPGSDVTLTSHVDDGLSNIFFTYSHFRANEEGKIDLSKDGSMGGSFKGVFQMGPIGCLKPGPETYKFYRYINQNVPVPMTVGQIYCIERAFGGKRGLQT
ncbi:hypothetical protein Avbf_11613 [Armadillidium vulgare]|nr:hypothetical protein Avbf_11613 [Armadillidium vulgare]